MTLEDLIARRDALLEELAVVRADIKLAKQTTPKPPNKTNQIRETARLKRLEALALRREGMTYRAIAEKIGRSPARIRYLVERAEREERRAASTRQ